MNEFAYMVGVKVLANLLCIAAVVLFCALLWVVGLLTDKLQARR